MLMKSLNDGLFNIDITTQPPQRGSLLVAEPFLADQYFIHAVITLIDYAEGVSAMGLVMNRISGFTLGQLVGGIDDKVDIPVFYGGPISHDCLFYMHRLGALISGASEIAPGLWIGGDYNQVMEYVKDGYPTDDLLRFFVGYSGWEPNQLEKEIETHTWAVTSQLAASQMLTDSDDVYWHKVVRSMGPEYRSWLFHPMFPLLN